MSKLRTILLAVSILIIAVIAIRIFTPKVEAPETQKPLEKIEVPAVLPVATISKKSSSKRIDPVPLEEKKEIAQKIANTFPEHKEVMVAIALSESGLNKNATGYNCYYKVSSKEAGGTYDSIVGKYLDFNSVSKTKLEGYRSTYCRTGDTGMAWSRDGGVFQINNPKPEDYNVDHNLARARAKYDGKGLSSWTVYNTGEYKKFLQKAKELLEIS